MADRRPHGDVLTAASFTFTPVQQRLVEKALDGETRIIGFGGAIRGTKTWGGIGLLILLCKMFPRSRWAIVRKDLPTLRRNTIPSFEKLRAFASGFVGPINQSTWTATCANGSELIFFPESRDGDADLTRWKGLEVNGFLLEEADELSVKSFHKAQERAGAWFVPNGGNQPPALIVATFNPSGGWVKETFYTPWKHGTLKAPYAFIPATILDNPFATQEYRDGLKAMPEAEYKRFVEGDWDVLAGRYFDELDWEGAHKVAPFDRTDHGTLNIPPYWEQWASYDWGFAHYAVACAFAKDTDGQTYLIDSVWMQRLADDEQALEMKRSLPQQALQEVYAGTDCWSRRLAHGGTAPTVAEVMHAHQIGLIQAATDRVPGWQTVRRALTRKQPDGTVGTPRLLFCDTPSNRKLFEQLGALEYDEIKREDVSKKKAELAGGDDGADALRYGLATRFPNAVEPKPWTDPWVQGHDPMALVPFQDLATDGEIGGGGISTWGF